MWSKDNFIKCGYFYIDKRPTQGNGDLLFNTCRMLLETTNDPLWARMAILDVGDCMLSGVRWPNSMDYVITTTTHKQDELTRDPFHPFYLCCIRYGLAFFIKEIKPPLRLYTPVFWTWRKYLIKRTKIRKCIWLFWEWVSPSGKKEFALRLRDYRLSTK